MFKKWIIGTLAGATLVLGACSTTSNPEVASTTAGRIRQDEFYEEMKNAPTETGATMGEQVLQQMLIETVLEENYGDQVSQDQVDAQMQNIAEQYGGQEQFDQIVEATGLDTANLEDNVRLNLYLEEAIRDHYNFDQAEVQSWYEDQVPEGTRVAHILVEEEEEAQDLINRLEEGADFGELAQEYSQDPGTAEEGGELELQSGQMVPEFEQAAMELEEGEITEEPVESQFGYHIIKMVELPEKPSFEGNEEEITDQYVSDVLVTDNTIVREVIGTLMTDANIQIADEELQGAIAPFVSVPEESQAEGDSGEAESTEEESSEAENSEEENSEEESSETENSEEESSEESAEN